MKSLLPILFVPFAVGVSIPAIAATSNVPVAYAERGLPLPISRKGTTINVTTGKISHIAISDKSCVVYTQIQNSILLKPISPCLQFDGVSNPDLNPTLRAWVDSKILEFRICSKCSGAKNINIVADITPAPIIKKTARLKSIPVPKAPSIVNAPIQMPAPPPPPLSSEVPSLVEKPSEQKFTLLKPIPQINNAQPIKAKKTRKPQSIETTKVMREASPQSDLSPSQRALKELALSKPLPKEKVETKITKIHESPLPATKAFKLSLGQSQAKALLKGLNTARLQKGKSRIAYRSRSWMQVQDVIYFLKINKPLDTAIKKAGASKSLVEKLIEMGRTGA